MTPTPIPDDMVTDGTRRIVVGPPDGDPTGDVRPVEALLVAAATGPRFCIRLALDDGELEDLQAGRPVWLLWNGDHLHPFSVMVESES